MKDLVDILLRPEFLLSAVVLVGGAILALVLTNRRFHRTPRFKPGRFEPDKFEASNPGEPASGDGSARPAVTFADVAGLDEAIDELREVKEYLADPERFRALGAELPRGILMYGPPGCGKTLLARALAGEAGVPFYFVSAASFVEKFVGLGAARVRQLFDEVKRNAPCIVFMDELDAIGRKRSDEAAGEREFDNTLNQLLVELDGFTGISGVLLLGATNRPELIDPALMRPGRFDRRIQIDKPDRFGRAAILRLHASKRPFSRQVDWDEVAGSTAGLTAAELANIVNEASLLAARRHRERISGEDVDEAVARILAGTKSGRLMSDDDKRLVAYHEAGHVVLSLMLRGCKPPSVISIVGRKGAFNKSVWAGSDDKEILTKRELMARLMVLLGGRAAELNVFGEPSTRAEDDLQEAADLARRMVERWAMTGRLELPAKDSESGRAPARSLIGDPEVREVLDRAELAARTILRDNADRIRVVADAFVERETLTSVEVARITNLWGWRHNRDGNVTPLRRARELHA